MVCCKLLQGTVYKERKREGEKYMEIYKNTKWQPTFYEIWKLPIFTVQRLSRWSKGNYSDHDDLDSKYNSSENFMSEDNTGYYSKGKGLPVFLSSECRAYQTVMTQVQATMKKYTKIRRDYTFTWFFLQ